MLPKSLTEARAAGLKQYFTGRPCKHGHVAPRQTSNGTCLVCERDIQARLKAKDPEAWKAKQKIRQKRHEAKHPDFHAAVYARHKEKIDARVKRWLADRPHYKAAVSHRRKLRLVMATPKWLTAEQHGEIDRIYAEAASRPGGPWHVDHIVPLQGRNVSGLHVPWNLQIITKAENLAKGAALIEELVAA